MAYAAGLSTGIYIGVLVGVWIGGTIVRRWRADDATPHEAAPRLREDLAHPSWN